MASPDPVGTPEQAVPPLIGTPDPKPSPELVAPSGWQKKISSTKKGSASSKRDVCFIAPDGEEIKTKKALDSYLKKHPGGASASEFDWSTGETPTRRSSRLSTKTRPSLDSPEGGSAEKRRKKKVEKDIPKDEAKGESVEVPPATEDTPLSDDVKLDEVMEDVEKGDVKRAGVVEEQPVVETDGKEVQAEKVGAETENVAVEDTQVDLEKKSVPEEITDMGKRVEDKEAAKEHESGSSLPNEDSNKAKLESTEKVSNVFQHCPEAPNASRPVDVST